MGYMQFKNPTLEQLFKSYKYARNNSIKIFGEACKQNILDFRSDSPKQTQYKFQTVLFQFQCLVSTTDAYFRKLTHAKNTNFGIYIAGNKTITKEELAAEEIQKILSKQLEDLQELLKNFDNKRTEKYIDKVGLILSHEHLHQGELILMFREVGAKLPESYVRAWAL